MHGEGECKLLTGITQLSGLNASGTVYATHAAFMMLARLTAVTEHKHHLVNPHCNRCCCMAVTNYKNK